MSTRETITLTELRAKARETFADTCADAYKELLFESLVEQSYYRGRMDAANDAIDRIRQENPDADAGQLPKKD